MSESKESMRHKYRLRYTWDTENRAEGYTVNDTEDRKGLCDAMLLTSIIRPHDGSYSQACFSFDGETGKPLTQKDIFKVWLTLGLSLEQERGLTGWQHELVKAVREMTTEIFKDKS